MFHKSSALFTPNIIPFPPKTDGRQGLKLNLHIIKVFFTVCVFLEVFFIDCIETIETLDTVEIMKILER